MFLGSTGQMMNPVAREVPESLTLEKNLGGKLLILQRHWDPTEKGDSLLSQGSLEKPPWLHAYIKDPGEQEVATSR